MLVRPALDGATAAMGAACAQPGRSLLHLPSGEPVRLRCAGADRPLPTETVRRSRAVEKMREHPLLTCPPITVLAYGPMTRHPHSGLVDHPAFTLELGNAEVDARHRSVEFRAARSEGLIPQRSGESMSYARIEMSGVLLPQQFVSELGDILRRSVIDVIPDLPKRQESVSDVRRQSRSATSPNWRDLVASCGVPLDAECAERLLRGTAPTGESSRADDVSDCEHREMVFDERLGGLAPGLRCWEMTHLLGDDSSLLRETTGKTIGIDGISRPVLRRRSDVREVGCSAAENGSKPCGDGGSVLPGRGEEFGVGLLDLRLRFPEERASRGGKHNTLCALIFITR